MNVQEKINRKRNSLKFKTKQYFKKKRKELQVWGYVKIDRPIYNYIMEQYKKWVRSLLTVLMVEIIITTGLINYALINQSRTSIVYIAQAQSQDMALPVQAGSDLDMETTESKISTLSKDAPSDTSSVQSLIRKIAKAENFENVDGLLRLAHCESRFNPKSFNPTNNSNDRGAFQISKRYHPAITDEQAYDVEWSTKWTINKIKAGGVSIWMCAHAYKNSNYKYEK